MKEYVEVFRECATLVLARMARLTPKSGEISRVSESRSADSLSVIVGLQGDLVGSVALVLSREVAWSVAERVGGEPIDPTAGFLVRSIVMEVADSIAGNAADRLQRMGLEESHTPPTVVEGPNVFFGFLGESETFCVPLETEAGACSLLVSLMKDDEN